VYLNIYIYINKSSHLLSFYKKIVHTFTSMSFKLQDFQAGIQLRVLVDKLTKIQIS